MRRLVTIALFIATIVAVGLLFLSVPNLELVTMTCFLAGYFLGTRDGVIAAGTGEAVFSILNPLGMAGVPLLVAQILGMSLTALVASLVARKWKVKADASATLSTALYFGGMGLLLTLTFDFLTTISFLVFAGFDPEKFLTSLVFGMYFYLTHVGLNTLIFALVLPVTIRRLSSLLKASPGMQV